MKKIDLSKIPSRVENKFKNNIIEEKLSNLSSDDVVLLIVIFTLIQESKMDIELLLCILYLFLDKDFDFNFDLFSFI